MHIDDGWWDTQNQLAASEMIVQVMCVSDETHVTIFPFNQYPCPLYHTIGKIGNVTDQNHYEGICVSIGLISGLEKDTTNNDEAWDYSVGTVLTPLRNHDITGPSLK